MFRNGRAVTENDLTVKIDLKNRNVDKVEKMGQDEERCSRVAPCPEIQEVCCKKHCFGKPINKKQLLS